VRPLAFSRLNAIALGGNFCMIIKTKNLIAGRERRHYPMSCFARLSEKC